MLCMLGFKGKKKKHPNKKFCNVTNNGKGNCGIRYVLHIDSFVDNLIT